MQLWVRSQDKERLTKTNQLELLELDTDVDPRYNHFGVYANEYLVGEYKSKERALEVLDEIQEILKGKYATNLNPKVALKSLGSEKNAEKLLSQMAVYEMPKE